MISAGISDGHVLAADWLFLIAAILCIVAFIINLLGDTVNRLSPLTLLIAAVGCVAFAWLLL